jgi:hypothetical protein
MRETRRARERKRRSRLRRRLAVLAAGGLGLLLLPHLQRVHVRLRYSAARQRSALRTKRLSRRMRCRCDRRHAALPAQRGTRLLHDGVRGVEASNLLGGELQAARARIQP